MLVSRDLKDGKSEQSQMFDGSELQRVRAATEMARLKKKKKELK